MQRDISPRSFLSFLPPQSQSNLPNKYKALLYSLNMLQGLLSKLAVQTLEKISQHQYLFCIKWSSVRFAFNLRMKRLTINKGTTAAPTVPH
jgi:hypothetical protein